MRRALSILCVGLSLACFGIAHASETEMQDFSVRAIEHNSDEVFPALMNLIEARQSLEAKDFERALSLIHI